MAALPDGEYILTERVENPIPSRLHSRRRGWMRADVWWKDTRFTIAGGVWSCDGPYGSARGTRLSDKQRKLVFTTIKPFLQPWAPALPSQFLPYDGGGDVLDFLVTTGRLTLDEVRAAYALRDVGGALAHALEAFHAAPVVAPEPPVSATVRVGDVIASGGGNGPRWVAIGVSGPEFLWQSAEGCAPFADRHRTDNEPVIGHVADMLAEGLAALSRGAGTFLRVGDVIVGDTSPDPFVVMSVDSAPKYTWQGTNPGTNPESRDGLGHMFRDGFHPARERVIGHVADMLAEGLAALSPVAAGPLLGYAYGRGAFAPVYVGDILIAEGNTAVRALVLEAAPSDAGGPRVRIAQLGGGDVLKGSLSLQPGNGWVHEDRSVLGYDCGGIPVRAGDVLRCVKDPPNHPRSVRLLVTSPAPCDGYGPCAQYKLLDGPRQGFDRLSLRPGNGWRVETPRPPEEHLLPRLEDLNNAPPNFPRGPKPRFETSAFTLDDRDPFTLD
jgi:hypothetical protein